MSTSTKNKPAAAAAPAKPALSPAEQAREIMAMAEDARPWELSSEVTKAEEALALAKARLDKAGEKQLRILRAKSLEEAQAILDENPADELLKKLCQRLSGWKPLQEKGATDQQIEDVLAKWPQYRAYPEKVPQAKSGFSGGPEAWVDEDKPRSSLSGEKLIAAVRRVMKIDKPAGPAKGAEKKPTPKPAPTKKPAAKKMPAAKTPPAPEDEDAGDAEDFDVETKTADADTMELLAEINSCGSMATSKDAKNSTACGLYEMIPGRLFVCVGSEWAGTGLGCTGADLIEVKPEGEFDGVVKVKSCYAGVPFKCKGKKYVVTGPRIRVVLNETPESADLQAAAKPKEQAKPKAAAKSASDKPNKQSWRQWTSTLKHLPEGVELSPKVPEFSSPTEREGFFLGLYLAGRAPSDALDAWREWNKPAAEPTKAEPACRVCGCTTHDCRGCIERLGEPCTWAEDPIEGGELCSACKPAEYGQMADGDLLGGGAVEDAVIIGMGERGGSECYQVKITDGQIAWLLVKGSKVNGKARLIDTVGDEEEEEDDAGDADLAGLMQDPNVNEHGVYMKGVREIVVPGIAKSHKTGVKILIALGNDGLYRTALHIDVRDSHSSSGVSVESNGVQLESYAIRAAANIALNRLRADNSSDAAHKAAAKAAIAALQEFIDNNPACQSETMANA